MRKATTIERLMMITFGTVVGVVLGWQLFAWLMVPCKPDYTPVYKQLERLRLAVYEYYHRWGVVPEGREVLLSTGLTEPADWIPASPSAGSEFRIVTVLDEGEVGPYYLVILVQPPVIAVTSDGTKLEMHIPPEY